MRRRYTPFFSRQPSRLAPSTALKAAMWIALERAWSDPRHPISEKFRGTTPSKTRGFAHPKPKR
jgi:hypothetical protein